MSNDVINPYQVFRDDVGEPLAGGKLFIRVNRTTTPGTAFANSALTTPQDVSPYTLDNYGRVRGDLRWQGLRTIRVEDAGGAHIRTLNDVATLVDTSEGFATVFESVAAMAADTTLEADDVVETLSYNAGQRQGGARYLVTSSSETVDDYRVIDLAPAGLQARLLDEELHRSPFAAGAVGDLTADDTDAVQAVLDAVTDVKIDGTFLCDNLTVSASKRLSGGGTLKLTDFAGTDLLSVSGTDVLVLIDGITLDGNVSNQSAERETALIAGTVVASAASTLAAVRCNNVTFQNASQHDVKGVADDMGFQVIYALSGCTFIDGEESTDDTATACVRMEDGATALIDDCYFSLGATVDVGRAAVTTGNSGSAVTNYGNLAISGCTLNLMGQDSSSGRAAIHATEINQLQVQGNRLLTPNYGGVAFGAECSQVMITDNLIDGLTGTDAIGQIVALTTTAANSGADWQIEGNELLDSTVEAIALDGSSAGTDAQRVRVLGNLIEGSDAQAITYTDIIDLDLVGNFIDMAEAAGINAIEAITNGITGRCQVAGNTVLNVDNTTSTGGTAFDDQVSTGGVYEVDGNYFEGGAIGLQIDGGPDELVLINNVFDSITDTLGILDNVTDCFVDGNSYLGSDPTNFLTLTGGTGITDLKVGDNFWTQVDSTINVLAVTGSNITVGAPRAKYMLLDPTGATNVDSVDSPGIDGYQLVLQNFDGAAAITFDDAAGNINLGASTRVLTDVTDTLVLVWNEANSEWNELSYSNN